MRTLLATLALTLACAASSSDAGQDPHPPRTNAQKVCAGAPACGADGPACPQRMGCYQLAACGGPVCLEPEEACDLVCGQSTCDELESYPLQVSCGNEAPAASTGS